MGWSGVMGSTPAGGGEGRGWLAGVSGRSSSRGDRHGWREVEQRREPLPDAKALRYFALPTTGSASLYRVNESP